MKRLMTVLGAMAAVGLMVGTACADLQNFQLGMNEFALSNCEYAINPSVNPAFAPGGWTATTNGALWIATAGGTPVINTQDLNLQLDYRPTPTSAWIQVTGAYLLSNGVAAQDCNWLAYPGEFGGCDGVMGIPADDSSPYRYPYAGMGEYVLPGTGPTPDYPYGQPTQGGMQFNLYAWTGMYNSFSAAAGAGADVAISGAFQVGTTSYSINFFDFAFSNMPSMLLKPTITGDANLDGRVDINDLTVVLANYGQTGMTWAQGEFTGDGTVDINDLTIVLAHYNQSVASSGAGMVAVPEPSPIAIAAAVLLGLVACCRRKRTVGPACRAGPENQ